MDGPAIVIEMAQAEREAPGVREMLAACTASVRDGCAIADGSTTQADARAIAVVTWPDADRREVRIEVGLRARGDRPAHWLSRSLALRESDPLAERWRAVGLVIATLVGEEEERAAASAPRPPPPPPLPPPPPPPVVAARMLAWLDATAWVAPALDSGSVFIGGAFRGAWYPARVPVFVVAGGAYGSTLTDSSGVRVDSISGLLGVGASYDRIRFVRFEGMLAFRVERIGATVNVSSTGESDAAQTVFASALLGADVEWVPIPHFGVVFGADGFLRAQGAVVQLRSVPIGRVLPFSAAAHLGVRVDF